MSTPPKASLLTPYKDTKGWRIPHKPQVFVSREKARLHLKKTKEEKHARFLKKQEKHRNRILRRAQKAIEKNPSLPPYSTLQPCQGTL